MKRIYLTFIGILLFILFILIISTENAIQKLYLIVLFILIIIWSLLVVKISGYLNRKFKRISKKYDKFVYVGREAEGWGIISGVSLFLLNMLFTKKFLLDKNLKNNILILRILSVLIISYIVFGLLISY